MNQTQPKQSEPTIKISIWIYRCIKYFWIVISISPSESCTVIQRLSQSETLCRCDDGSDGSSTHINKTRTHLKHTDRLWMCSSCVVCMCYCCCHCHIATVFFTVKMTETLFISVWELREKIFHKFSIQFIFIYQSHRRTHGLDFAQPKIFISSSRNSIRWKWWKLAGEKRNLFEISIFVFYTFLPIPNHSRWNR